MEINAEQESLAARRTMEESTRYARDAARDAQQALHEVNTLTWKASTAKQKYSGISFMRPKIFEEKVVSLKLNFTV